MIRFLPFAAAALAVASPAAAKVHETAPEGFVLRHGIDVSASPERAWALLLDPSQWWSKSHSFSGDPANFSLDPRAGGCFCEILPNEASPAAAPRGSVEHMRVIYIEEPRALRLSGALGLLQPTGANGTLTIFLRPQEEGTRILMEYVVGGYMRGKTQRLASSVDLVLNEQILRLGQKLGVGTASKEGGGEAEPGLVTEDDGEDVAEPPEDDFAEIMREAIEEPAPASEVPEPPTLPGDDGISPFEGR